MRSKQNLTHFAIFSLAAWLLALAGACDMPRRHHTWQNDPAIVQNQALRRDLSAEYDATHEDRRDDESKAAIRENDYQASRNWGDHDHYYDVPRY
jgi:hypothetical protein